jgi:hypothetical protein
MPKKQTTVYWTEVKTDDHSIEFKKETSETLTYEDVTTIKLKIKKDKKYKTTTRLCFLMPFSEATIKRWISWEYQTRLNIDARYMSVEVEQKETENTFECNAVNIRMVVAGMNHAYENDNVNLLDSVKTFVGNLGNYSIRSVYGKVLPSQTTTNQKTTTFLEVLEENKPSTMEEFASFGVEDKTKQGKKATSNTDQQRQRLQAMDVASHDTQQGALVVDIDEPSSLFWPIGAPNAGQASRPYLAATNPAKTPPPNPRASKPGHASRPHLAAPNPAKAPLPDPRAQKTAQASQPNTVIIFSSDSENEDPTVIDLDSSTENSPRAPAKNKPQQSQKATKTTPADIPNAPKQAVRQDRPQAQRPAQKTTAPGPGAEIEAVPEATREEYEAKLSSDDSDSDEDIFVPKKQNVLRKQK